MLKSIIKKFIPPALLDFYHFFLALAGAIFYEFPSRKLKVIGVTGTNGKSTVVLMIAEILREAGFKTASLSSISFKIGEKEWPNTLKMTMPGRFKIQKFLRQAVKGGCKYAVLEVTSEGIKQCRHRFIDFDAAVFTNLSKEHIERHGGFEKYREAKGKLFQVTKNIHVINRDDENSDYFWQFSAGKKIGYRYDGSLNLKLPGEFNNYNAAAAVAVGLAYGIDIETCKKAMEKIESISGRMEVVVKEPFKVVVDYAHTPEALQKVYETLRRTGLRMICVLGAAGGGRDKWKRPELGKIAAQYCDEIILTNEDPYDENPQYILDQIEGGFSQIRNPLDAKWTSRRVASEIRNYMKILDRKEAIGKALSLARPGDTVIITGKGSEPWMCVAGGKKISWSDKQIVLDMAAKSNTIKSEQFNNLIRREKMFWTIEEEAEYITKAAVLAREKGRDVKEAVKKALEEIKESKKGSSWSGV